MPAVRTSNLTKDFSVGFWRPRPRRALDGLSLEISSGGVFGLLGPNGAGKSTTFKLLLDLLRPTSGSVEVFGRSPSDALVRRRLGFLPEQPAFYDHLSAEELLVYFAGLGGDDPATSRRRAAVALERVSLPADDWRRPLRQYSKGMLQRVGLAQAIVSDPELVILDEPMSGLDPAGRREVHALILALRDEGRTVLFSSHILSDAETLCSRVAILSQGRLAAAGTVSELTAGEGHGWEIVASGVGPELEAELRRCARQLTLIADRRVSLELGPDERPEPVVARLSAAGALLVSVQPVRSTLEDVFMRVSGRPGRS